MKNEAGVGPFFEEKKYKLSQYHIQMTPFQPLFSAANGQRTKYLLTRVVVTYSCYGHFLLIYFSATILGSVTRFGNFLHFGQPFKAGGNNYFTQITHIVRQFLKRCQNHSFFQCIHFWANFIDIWRFLSGHTASGCTSGLILVAGPGPGIVFILVCLRIKKTEWAST